MRYYLTLLLGLFTTAMYAATPGIGNNNRDLIILMLLAGLLLAITYGLQKAARKAGPWVRQWFRGAGSRHPEEK
jgi:hypothetical protein